MELLKDFSGVLASIVLGIIGFVLSVYHHKNSVKLAKQQHSNAFELQRHEFEKGLFEKYNSKYDKLNGSLNEILNLNLENLLDIKEDENYNLYYATIIDYFNLCAEQNFWYKKGRIDEDVWRAWSAGMNYYYNNSIAIKNMWQKEIADEGYITYYLEKGECFFKENKKD